MKKFSLFLALSLPFLSAISSQDELSPGLKKAPLKANAEPYDGPLFEKLPPSKTGLEHSNPILPDHPMARVYHSSSACAGIAIGDVNLDGKLDIFSGNGPEKNSLFLGKPDGNGLEFENVAAKFGLEGEELEWATGVSLIDIDNDGDLDIYITNYDFENRLFINQLKETGKLGFVDKAAEFGVNVVDGCVMPAFADYDRDGDLDLYILTHQVYRANGRPAEPIAIIEENGEYDVAEKWQRWFRVQEERREDGAFQYTEVGRPDYLFRNDGGKFTEVTEAAGITKGKHWGNSSTWWDYNHDGWPDLYVGNDFSSPDYLYRNNGDGTFDEISKESLRHSTWFSMGAVQTDLNNDGLTDFVLADMLPTSHYMQKASMGSMGARLENLKYVDGARQLMRNAVYINTGTDQFLEGAWLSNLAMTEWTWAIRSQDFDNDGLNDVFFTNGIPRQFNHSDLPNLEHEDLVGRTHWSHYKGTEERREQNLMYRNKGGFQFEDVSRKWGVDHLGMSYGASTADFDGDGRLELLVSNLQDPLSFYHNREQSGNRVVFDFVGTDSNPFGIGVSVTLKAGDETFVRQLFPAGGFLDGDDTIVHFGLGEHKTLDTVSVEWPSGKKQVFRNLEANHLYTVTEPKGDGPAKSKPIESRKPENTLFESSKALDGFTHVELEFDDFVRQPLLPRKMSQLGPGQAWADVDGDGDPDFYLGGAAGQPGQLFKNHTKPGAKRIDLLPEPVAAFADDGMFEDMGCLFFDADSDGDLDLYVASGGVESAPNGSSLRDRLYLNDGSGNFKRAPESALPVVLESSSVVAAADYDHDGDLDLFVGSRSVPGEYPRSPKSVLLRNDGGKFKVVTNQAASGLEEIGMVTSAIWSDVDGDGWSDLLVALDWGPVKVLRNRKGKLEMAADEDTGFADIQGWFNGINGADIDNDGDIDYVVTNLGLNTQYQASIERPVLVYYGDFEGTGKANIVEAIFEEVDGKVVCYPFRGKSCSTHAMPSLKRIPTYEQFAKATLPEIYGNTLDNAIQFKVTNFNSLVMINDGSGKFDVKPLPHLAQISPSFGVTLTDFNLDGRADCYLTHNFFTPQPEVGAMDSGLSLLLRGTGDAAKPFEEIWPKESGLEVPGDAKSLAAVDVNLDGLNDFVIGQNDDEPRLFVNKSGSEEAHPIRIRLVGKAGNPRAIGARVTFEVEGMPAQTAEIRAGGGYLTQENTDLIFAVPNAADGKKAAVKIRWPDGAESEQQVDAKGRFAKLTREG
ncbi:MAG: hypothetical protein HKN23_17375 [Verrucomicrobiales bacterium]|nr:hypothetical protein [Verrucomicrobiales bacterium]